MYWIKITKNYKTPSPEVSYVSEVSFLTPTSDTIMSDVERAIHEDHKRNNSYTTHLRNFDTVKEDIPTLGSIEVVLPNKNSLKVFLSLEDAKDRAYQYMKSLPIFDSKSAADITTEILNKPFIVEIFTTDEDVLVWDSSDMVKKNVTAAIEVLESTKKKKEENLKYLQASIDKITSLIESLEDYR